MKKTKVTAFILALITLLALSSCRKAAESPAAPDTTEQKETDNTSAADTTKAPDSESETDAESTTEKSGKVENSDEALARAKEFLGERDEEAGYDYAYRFDSVTEDGSYKIKVSWYLQEDDRYSTCGYLLVSPDGSVTKFDW